MAAGATTTPEYEEFEPYCKWRREQEYDTVEVHLQGFKKDQLNVRLSNDGVLSVSGERPLDETEPKRCRFKKEIRLSKDHKNDDIGAKLVGGVLSINMPKKPSNELSNGKNSMRAGYVAAAVALIVILAAFAIYRCCQPSSVHE